ncbi:hydrogen gas-evolving membrane-bound hydrogenase subunit E [Devosia sp. Root635]|uniref:hydrogen gas-evolving membrane-bound hydrogenase subunit E n=1 Tax=Devosia sp. Root635 TaxID=1736575 RepID=UPI0006F5FB02|nr:hydrogen gas-evolving membrane-bound hydrogenase subunit E [Devosia sp. Root635]KRA55821.1 cation:proton antiporter [Devosia sp. Root635]
MDASIALVAIAPFVAALLAPFIHRLARPYAGWVLALVPAGIFLFLLTLIAPVVAGGAISARIGWVPAFDLDLSFFVDGLSLTFALTISGIGTLIVLYSGAYLKGHPHLGRFLGFLLAFMGAMLGLVLADNMLALFMFWELTSVTSFLLIGFDHTRQAARRGAIQALVLTNIGGMALLVGAILVHQLTGCWDMSALGDDVRANGFYGLTLALFLVAAFTKSAQVPLHFWLPNAMEAPTPVSAFLHSATMVQGGVYLLARTTPWLGGTEAWTLILVCFGGATLLWGGLGALRQTDLKQMLAQTTLASLGLSVLLIGLGTEAAIAAMLLYFVAHALYKAGLFMVVGAIDHEAGTRDITILGGLADRMPVTFIGAALASLAMIGLPLTLGYFAKEEMYLGLMHWQWSDIAVLAVLLAGNAMLAGVAMLVLVKPFLGPVLPTPKLAHEAPIAMLAGPIVLGGAGIVASVMTDWLGHTLVEPGAAAILGETVSSHLTLTINPASPLLWLSIATWALGYLVYRQAAVLRTLLRRFEAGLGWTADTVFDAVMFGLIRFSGAVTRLLHHGRLEIYLATVFAGLALALIAPLGLLNGYDVLLPNADLGNWSAKLSWPQLQPYEWGVMALALIGLGAVLLATNRLVAILALGIQGTSVALIFLLFGAPDLAFTQFMVEVLSVVILALVMTRLRLDELDQRPLEDLARDGILALVCGAGVSLLLMVVLSGTLDTRLSDLFTATSVPIAHGHNIVNVILVDYRGFDTLGEISVVMAAGIAVMALLRRRNKPAVPASPAPRRRRKAES